MGFRKYKFPFNFKVAELEFFHFLRKTTKKRQFVIPLVSLVSLMYWLLYMWDMSFTCNREIKRVLIYRCWSAMIIAWVLLTQHFIIPPSQWALWLITVLPRTGSHGSWTILATESLQGVWHIPYRNPLMYILKLVLLHVQNDLVTHMKGKSRSINMINIWDFLWHLKSTNHSFL